MQPDSTLAQCEAHANGLIVVRGFGLDKACCTLCLFWHKCNLLHIRHTPYLMECRNGRDSSGKLNTCSVFRTPSPYDLFIVTVEYRVICPHINVTNRTYSPLSNNAANIKMEQLPYVLRLTITMVTLN